MGSLLGSGADRLAGWTDGVTRFGGTDARMAFIALPARCRFNSSRLTSGGTEGFEPEEGVVAAVMGCFDVLAPTRALAGPLEALTVLDKGLTFTAEDDFFTRFCAIRSTFDVDCFTLRIRRVGFDVERGPFGVDFDELDEPEDDDAFSPAEPFPDIAPFRFF